jgi:hypothetical protein
MQREIRKYLGKDATFCPGTHKECAICWVTCVSDMLTVLHRSARDTVKIGDPAFVVPLIALVSLYHIFLVLVIAHSLSRRGHVIPRAHFSLSCLILVASQRAQWSSFRRANCCEISRSISIHPQVAIIRDW